MHPSCLQTLSRCLSACLLYRLEEVAMERKHDITWLSPANRNHCNS